MILNAYQEQPNHQEAISSIELSNYNNCQANQIAVNHQKTNISTANKSNVEGVPLKIIKSFYKKDALASVTDSFLRLDENYAAKAIHKTSAANNNSSSTSSSIEQINKVVTTTSPNQQSTPNQNGFPQTHSIHNSSSATSSSYSLSSSSVAPNHRPIISEINNTTNDQLDNSTTTTTSSPSSSCILFVNQLVEPKFQQLNNNNTNITMNSNNIMYNNNRPLVTTTINPATLHQINANNAYVQQSMPPYHHSVYYPSNSTTNMKPVLSTSHHSPPQYHAENLCLLSKKMRKYLPFNCGLKNHGNTCFMNCVLQALFHTSPLADFFITMQFENDIREIQQSQQSKPNQFLLTRHFSRLFTSMWNNSYEGNYSAEMKNVIGYLNPVFAGAQQNDSHEFCVWFLDRLSSELMHKLTPLANMSKQLVDIPSPPLSRHRVPNPNRQQRRHSNDRNLSSNESDDAGESGDEQNNTHEANEKDQNSTDQGQKGPISSSFIEDLFKIHFKSSVICSICGYKSSKSETDMMLSLPLPQSGGSASAGRKVATGNQRHFERRSLYFNLMLVNAASIRLLTNGYQSIPNSHSSSSSEMNDNVDNRMATNSRFYITETSLDNQADNSYQAPLHVKLGVNLHLSSDQSIQRELISLSNESTSSTVINPTFGDLRQYVESSCKLSSSNGLVFVDLTQPEVFLNDRDSLKDVHARKGDVFAIELFSNPRNRPSTQSQQQSTVTTSTEIQQPMINLVAVNVHPIYRNGTNRLAAYGLPFAVHINRDCTYPELCRKLLDSQTKYLKDKNMLKYKDLAPKMFSLSLVDPNSKKPQRLNPSDELPLYAECVDKALNEIAKYNQEDTQNSNEHIRINIEWRSDDDLDSIFKKLDSSKAEFVHRTVQQLQRVEEQEREQGVSNYPSTYSYESGYSQASNSTNNASGMTTLNDCFELFTQLEELSDENSWMCTKCKKQTNAYKKLCISSVPPVLIIHLKRFFYKSKTSNFKLTTPVLFPVSNLDMSKYLAKGKLKNNTRVNGLSNNIEAEFFDDGDRTAKSVNSKYIYDLFAVCNHKGQNMANGHYTAYCKNPIDTRWYCFDDSTCTPLYDPNITPSNIHNTGSANIFTENAYILFYKRRSCLRNERWWKPYVERSLYDYDEYSAYLANMDAIEKQQQIYQQKQEQQISNNTSVGQNSQNSQFNSKRMTSLKSIKERILGNSSGQQSHHQQHQQQFSNDLIDIDYGYDTYRPSQPYSNKPIFDNSVINHYDEYNKPQRLLRKMNSKDTFSVKPATINLVPSSSSVDSSPVSSSSSSYNNPQQGAVNKTSSTENNNLINLNDPLVEKIDSIKALSRDLSHQMAISNNDIFKYPSDNEYMYQQNQENQQRLNNAIVNTTNIPAYKQSDFYYTQRQHPTHAYFQQQQQQQLQQQQQNRAQINNNNPNAQIQSSRNGTPTGTKSRYINSSIETPI